MSAEPSNAEEYWHVTDVPKRYLTAGMATVLVFEDTAIGTFYHHCMIDRQGYIRPMQRGGERPYLRKGETKPDGAYPPVDDGGDGR